MAATSFLRWLRNRVPAAAPVGCVLVICCLRGCCPVLGSVGPLRQWGGCDQGVRAAGIRSSFGGSAVGLGLGPALAGWLDRDRRLSRGKEWLLFLEMVITLKCFERRIQRKLCKALAIAGDNNV